MPKKKESGLLSDKEAGHPGCGLGTENACFALVRGREGFACGMIKMPETIGLKGIRLGWRVNVDPTDKLAWCPKGTLNHSKLPPGR